MTTIRLANDSPTARQNVLTGLVCFLSIVLIGAVDYITGYRISLLSFYALPIGFAALYAGPEIAFLLALCAIAISRATDFLSGMPYPGNQVFFWNCLIPVVCFSFFILVLRLLHLVRLRLEKTVEDRNRALLQEMHERGRLEREVIELSEREHRRFGQELHDLVSQELASIAIDSHFLARNLMTGGNADAERARDIALKVDRALSQARNIARGNFALGLDSSTGLADALREIAHRAQKESGITTKVRCEDNLALGNQDATVQLFRIAQEAVQNAVRHSAAKEMTISFERRDDAFIFTVEDNGKGLPATSAKKGLGFSVMAYRASLIGGTFATERPATGGTRVTCRVPASKLNREGAALRA